MVDYINKGKNLKTKPVGSINKNKCMANCGEVPFGILSYYRYIDLEKKKTVSCKIEKDEYRLSGTKSKKIVIALTLLKVPLFIGFLKKLKEKD